MDFDAEQDYAFYGIKTDLLSGALLEHRLFVKNELRMHEAEFDNNLYSPLRINRDKFRYMSSESISSDKVLLNTLKFKTKDLIQIEIVT